MISILKGLLPVVSNITGHVFDIKRQIQANKEDIKMVKEQIALFNDKLRQLNVVLAAELAQLKQYIVEMKDAAGEGVDLTPQLEALDAAIDKASKIVEDATAPAPEPEPEPEPVVEG